MHHRQILVFELNVAVAGMFHGHHSKDLTTRMNREQNVSIESGQDCLGGRETDRPTPVSE